QVDIEHFKSNLDNDTRFVTTLAVNNIIGSVQPIEEMVKILKDFPKVHFHVDATQAIGKADIDYRGVDTVSISGHKFNSVKGVGGLFVKKLANLSPIQSGGGHDK